MGYVSVTSSTSCCCSLPLVTAGMTTFYMFRMWFLTFTGKPRDQHVHEHAHESPPDDDGAADRAGGLQRRRRLGLAGVGRRRELPRHHVLEGATSAGWRRARHRRRRRQPTTPAEHHHLAGGWPWRPLALGRGRRVRVRWCLLRKPADPAEAKEQPPGCTASCRQVVLRRAVQRGLRPALAVALASGGRAFDDKRRPTRHGHRERRGRRSGSTSASSTGWSTPIGLAWRLSGRRRLRRRAVPGRAVIFAGTSCSLALTAGALCWGFSTALAS